MTLAAVLLLVASPAGLASGLGSLLPIVIILPVLYFLMIRPNQKKQQQWQQMLSALKPGDRIVTTGGLRGTVLALRADALHIRVAPDGVKLEIVRSAIASVTTDEAK